MSSSRGDYSPVRWTKSFVKQKREHIKPDTQKNPLRELLKTIKHHGLKSRLATMPTNAQISDVCYITSYNWRNDGEDTILVPGKSIHQDPQVPT